MTQVFSAMFERSKKLIDIYFFKKLILKTVCYKKWLIAEASKCSSTWEQILSI